MSEPSTSPAVANTGAAEAKIADLSYRNYDGPLHSRAFRWWTVALAIVRMHTKSKMFTIPTLAILLIYMINGARLYLEEGTGMAKYQAQSNGYVDEYTMLFHSAMEIASFFLFLIAMGVGAGSIADDNRANALLIYLSKPITRTDYLLGKWMGVFIMVATASCLPALGLYLFFFGTYYSQNFFANNPYLILKVSAATLLAAALFTSVVIGFSALNKNARTAAVLFAGFFLILKIIVSLAGETAMSRFEHENRAELMRYSVNPRASMSVDEMPARPTPEFLAKAQPQLTSASTVKYLDVGGVASGVTLHLYDANPPLFDPSSTLRQMHELKIRPHLAPLILLGLVFLIVPVVLARFSIRAVEIIRG
jgi:ABC-2 type transport system permease protein